MTEAQMKAEITALRALLARVAGETGIREINGWQSRGKPIRSPRACGDSPVYATQNPTTEIVAPRTRGFAPSPWDQST